MTALLTPPPVTAGPRPWRLSRAEYYRLGELGAFDGKRVQLIRGEVIVMSPMNRPHAIAISLTSDALGTAFGPGFTVQVQLPFDLAGSEPEPDVSIITGAARDYTDHPTSALLVVEVSDSTLQYDLTTKAELYAEAGIEDYWVLDLNARTLHVLRDPRHVSAGGWAYCDVRVLSAVDSVTPLAAPQSLVQVADLLP